MTDRGGIPFVITRRHKSELRARGFSDEQIAEMTPAQAHEALGIAAPAPAAEPTMMTPEEKRLELLAAGFSPVPVVGKRPVIDGWQHRTDSTADEIRFWGRSCPAALNTGILTTRVPALDIDIFFDPAAAAAVEALARERFEEHGYILVRFGRAPKRAILFRTDTPFDKITALLLAPDGSEERLELLGARQQVVVDGAHPDTGKPYSWHGGEPGKIKREELPYIHPEEAKTLVDDAAALLVRDYGYRRKDAARPKPTGNGADNSSPADWTVDFADHDQLAALAMKLGKSGMNDGAAVNFLRAQVERTDMDLDRKARRLKEIPDMVASARGKLNEEQGPPDDAEPPPLPFVDLALPLKPRDWLIHERIPMLNVTLLSGEGAAGKSTLLMQLAGSTVLGKGWIGMIPAQGPALYVSCEEDHDEVRRRMEDVAAHLGSTRAELIERGLRVLSFAGLDAILGEPDRAGVIRPTRLFIQIRSEAEKLRPKLIVVDTVADAFGGDEIKRAQARQFITILRGLAIAAGAAVVLAAHPSLAGIANDTGLSGSTGWHNSVRARAYFKAGPGEDPTLRALEFRKNNYGPPDAPAVLLRWQAGVYLVETEGSFEAIAAQAEMDQLFLKLLRRSAEQGRHVSDKASSSYAPAVFVDDPEAKAAKATKKKLAEAMARLFAAKRIRVVAFGRPGKSRSYISENTENNPRPTPPNAQIIPFPAAQRPPNDPVGPPNHPPNGCPTTAPDAPNTPPIPPTPLGGANGALLEAGPAPPDGVSPAKKPPLAYEVIGQAPAGERCSLCGGGSPRPMRIKHGGETDIWHEACAAKYMAALADPPPAPGQNEFGRRPPEGG